MLKGFQNEAKMDAGAAVGSQLLDFGSQNLQNIIVDAERHRRTPGTPVT